MSHFDHLVDHTAPCFSTKTLTRYGKDLREHAAAMQRIDQMRAATKKRIAADLSRLTTHTKNVKHNERLRRAPKTLNDKTAFAYILNLLGRNKGRVFRGKEIVSAIVADGWVSLAESKGSRVARTLRFHSDCFLRTSHGHYTITANGMEMYRKLFRKSSKNLYRKAA